MATTSRTLIVIGSGPGIGRAMAILFGSKRFKNVVLIARRPEQLALDQSAVENTVGADIKVKTYAVDVTNSVALLKALDDAETHFGKPECIFYNAARVLPSQLLDHDVTEIEYDFKINVSALYIVAQREMPHLISLAKVDPSSKPALIVTSSLLPQHPIPQFFALSLVKAAQRNLVQCLAMTYASQGVHVGIINIGGQVSPTEEERNPTNIAARTWEWYAESRKQPRFEVEI